MADLEAVLADVSYLMAMEKSRSQPAARASKRIVLPDPRCDFAIYTSPEFYCLHLAIQYNTCSFANIGKGGAGF